MSSSLKYGHVIFNNKRPMGHTAHSTIIALIQKSSKISNTKKTRKLRRVDLKKILTTFFDEKHRAPLVISGFEKIKNDFSLIFSYVKI